MVSLIETPTRLVVTGLAEELAVLKEKFRYHPKSYFRSDAYQLWKLTGGEKGWDGYRYPLQLKTPTAGEILRGRKLELLELCRKFNFQVNLERCLVSPFKDIKLADIPDDLIEADFQLDVNQKQAIVEWLKHGMGVANMAVNSGKCLGRGTPVLCFDGSTKVVEEVQVGDLLMGPDSQPRKVLALGSGAGPLFKVVQGNGDAYSCNGDHILALESSGYFGRGDGKYGSRTWSRSSGRKLEVSIADYLKWPKTRRAQHKGYKAGLICFSEASVPLEPYFLGLWLGNGNSANQSITLRDGDAAVLDYLRQYAASFGLVLSDGGGNGCTTWRLSSPLGKGAGAWKNPVLVKLRQLRVIGDKHIPASYLRNSAEVRWQLLSGLIDTDGAIGGCGVELTFTKERLAHDALWLLRSLGLRATLTLKRTSCQTGAEGVAWRIWAKGDFSKVATRAKRKYPLPVPKRGLRYAIKVEELSVGDWFGFTLDGDGLFLLGDFTVTHNTATFAAAASYIKRHFPDARFLYFTFAERLVKQVMEAMSTFLPDWNITQYGGGGKRDLTGRDMIIATQAILNRNFSWLAREGFYKTFHALLLDECVAGDTKVRLSCGGELSIREITRSQKSILIRALNESTDRIEMNLARGICRGKKPTFVVRTETSTVRCTANHPFLTQRGWVQAQALQPFDYVLEYHDLRARTVSFREPIGRCLDGHPREMPLAANFGSTQPEAKSLGRGQIRDTEAFYRNTAKNSSKWRMGRFLKRFYDAVSTSLQRSLRSMLPAREEDCIRSLAFAHCGARTGVVVHGRREQEHSRDKPGNRGFSIRRAADSAKMVVRALGHIMLDYKSKTGIVVHTVVQVAGAQVLRISGSAHYSDHALQAVCCATRLLPDVRQELYPAAVRPAQLQRRLLQRAQAKTGSTALQEAAPRNTGAGQGTSYFAHDGEALRSLPESFFDGKAQPDALFQPGLCQGAARLLEPSRVVSVEATGRLEEVFDLTVNANHNFFANGVLVHNSHHCQSPSAEKVIRGCSAYFRLAASDSLKESDPDKFNRISGLCGPVLCQVTSSSLIEQSRSAAPQLYLVDIPAWRGRFRHVSHSPEPRSVAWTLVDNQWIKGTYLGPLYVLDENGKPKTKQQRRLVDGEWTTETVYLTVPTFHRLWLNGAETAVPARFTLLDRRYDKAIIRFEERNQLICEWAKFYSDKGWRTVVVATRTTHVIILEAMLAPLIPGLVRSLTGEASTPQRNEMFAWLNRTPGCVLITPLIKEGVSLPKLRAGVIADPVADFEVAKQILGRFMRKKEIDNTCSVTWFRDSQHPRYDKNFVEMFGRLEKIEGFTFYHPVAGPETIPQALVYHGNL